MNTPSTAVSPGLGGFIALFVLAVALWLLMRNMNTRLRRLSYREELEARQAEARKAQAEAAAGTPAAKAVDADPAGDSGTGVEGGPRDDR